MAFPTTSDPFRAMIVDALAAVAAFDLGGAGVHTFKAALFNDSVTGTKDDSSSASAYGGASWPTSQEVSDTTGWPAGGRALDNVTLTTPSSGVIRWDCDDVVGSACTTGLNSFYGWFVYDDSLTSPVADQGVCFNYFGGSQTVGPGSTLTVVINANGLWEITI